MVVFAIFVALAALAVAAVTAMSNADRRAGLEWRIAALAKRLDNIEARTAPPPPAPEAPAREAPAAPAPSVEHEPVSSPPRGNAEVPVEAERMSSDDRPKSGEAAVAWLARIEEQLMRRWMIWFGALALALGLVFLVRYSIERGFFGPTARVVSGTLLGGTLLILGEWVRRRQPALSVVEEKLNYIPVGLTAAGIVGLFASFYAAYSLYDLLSPLVTFVLLAGVAASAALLAVIHGPFLAVLGLGGAYVVPMLITTPHPSLWGLLAYILLVTAGSLLLVRWRGWLWLGWIVTIGTAFWAVTCAVTSFDGIPDRSLPLGLFFVILSVLVVGLLRYPTDSARRPVFAWTALIFSALVMIGVVSEAMHSTTALTLSFVLSAVLCALAFRDQGFDRLTWLGTALQVGVIASWHFVVPERGAPISSFLSIAPPPILTSYLLYDAVIAAGIGLVGFLALWRVKHPARWALISAASPVVILAIAYWRAERLGVSFPWAAAALALAALNLMASEALRTHRGNQERNAALAAYAVAMIASIALGLTMSLRTAWLSVALAMTLPALVWLYDRTSVKAVRVTAIVMASIVLLRLVINPSIIDYAFGDRPLFNGLLYTYGIPVAAFWLAARGFKHSGQDVLVVVLESGTLALAMALVSLEIRHALHGGAIGDAEYGLLEQGLQSDAWFAAAYMLLRRDPGPPETVTAMAWRILAGVAAGNLLLFSLLIRNPLFNPISVGRPLIFDALLFAYGVPAIFAALFAQIFRRQGQIQFADITGLLGVGLGFIYLSLEVRHLFQGEILTFGTPTDFEWYAYSVVWLLYGLSLMVTGIIVDLPKLRLAALAIGAVVSAKVFLFDTATLSGLYRAASFLGLGASLIGLGYLYQRFAQPPRPTGVGTSKS